MNSAENVAFCIVGYSRRKDASRPADRGGGHADDRIARIDDRGIVDGIAAHVVLAVQVIAFIALTFLLCEDARITRVVAISPVSISCLNRRRSRRVWILGSRWKSLATSSPITPPGGS
ncbi:hypothetical protein [Sphingobium xenophagum]|uniref:hypothetical protein n=1 Tax=Sphingobium xenophagum TaxID=121428 RepID=UPI003B8A94DA